MDEFYPSERPRRHCEGFASQPEPTKLLHGSLVVCADLGQVCELADGAGRAVLLVRVLESGFMGIPAVQRTRLGQTVAAGLLQTLSRGLCGPGLRAPKVPRLPGLIHGTGHIPLSALHLARRLIHAPADPHRPLATRESGRQLEAVLDDPPVARGGIDVATPPVQECFDLMRAQGLGSIPADPGQLRSWGQWAPLKRTAMVALPRCAPWRTGGIIPQRT